MLLKLIGVNATLILVHERSTNQAHPLASIMYKKKTRVDKPLLCVTYCLKLASVEDMYRPTGKKVIIGKKRKISSELNLLVHKQPLSLSNSP